MRDDLHQTVREEVLSLIRAATNAQCITQIAESRLDRTNTLDFSTHLMRGEIKELATGYADVSANARRLYLIGFQLGASQATGVAYSWLTVLAGRQAASDSCALNPLHPKMTPAMKLTTGKSSR